MQMIANWILEYANQRGICNGDMVMGDGTILNEDISTR